MACTMSKTDAMASCRRHPCQVHRCCRTVTRRMPLVQASHHVRSSCTWMCLTAVWTVARRHRRFPSNTPVSPIPRCRSLAAARINVDVVSENPLIWVVDGLCDGAKTRQLQRLLEEQDMDLLRKTAAPTLWHQHALEPEFNLTVADSRSETDALHSSAASTADTDAGEGRAAVVPVPVPVVGLGERAINPAELPTRGSAGHYHGNCKPCAFVYKGGCDSGYDCQFCHLCLPGEKIRRKKDAYVDDMFDQRRAAREDAQLLVYMMYAGALQFVPRQYRSDPLRSFLWLAVQRKELLPEGAWDIALASVARQAWCTQWNPEDLRRSGFAKSAARWRVPEAMLAELSPLVVDVLGAPVEGLPFAESRPFHASDKLPKWILRDTTVVRYQQDESQVPHIDTSDVTMLIYLSSSGGNTCFPNLQRSITPRAGRVLVFCSTTPGASRFGGFAGSAYGVPNDDTMHFGGLSPASKGEKLIVQLLFAALDSSLNIGSWDEALCGPALRQASYSPGVEAQALPAVPSASRLPRLATSPQRCATGCKGLALDLEAAPGEAKVCIHCWQPLGLPCILRAMSRLASTRSAERKLMWRKELRGTVQHWSQRVDEGSCGNTSWELERDAYLRDREWCARKPGITATRAAPCLCHGCSSHGEMPLPAFAEKPAQEAEGHVLNAVLPAPSVVAAGSFRERPECMDFGQAQLEQLEVEALYRSHRFPDSTEELLPLPLPSVSGLNCPLCHKTFEDPVMTVDGHTFCRRCIQDFFMQHASKSGAAPLPNSPVSGQPLLSKLLMPNLAVGKVLTSIRENVRPAWIQVEQEREALRFELQQRSAELLQVKTSTEGQSKELNDAELKAATLTAKLQMTEEEARAARGLLCRSTGCCSLQFISQPLD
ncbi:unnamed protein product [Symbiodinium sp. CCMP2456]|nr:unnamed protein product [Symbiodinium sp. CCMP2456]